jgi:poly(hydroxyalkanoate) granule-associated protein
MGKKTQDELSNKQLTQGIRGSANQIWLAGLAAFERAQAEGSKVFDTLVKEGEAVEARSRKFATEGIEAAKARVHGATTKAVGTVDKLEQVFQDRVSRSLKRLGVPSQRDLEHLTKEVEKLRQALAEMAKREKS